MKNSKKFTSLWAVTLITLGILLIIAIVTPSDGTNVLHIFSLFFLVAILVMYLCVAVHELGHLICAFIVKFQFVSIVVEPIIVSRTAKGLKFKVINGWSQNLGLTTFSPQDTNNLARRFIIFTAGGPIASLLLGIGAALVGWKAYSIWGIDLTKNLFSFADNQLLLVLVPQLTAVLSLSLGLGSLFPINGNGLVRSDGSRLIALLSGGAVAERHCALITIAMASQKQRPSEWEQEWISLITSPKDGSTDDAIGNYLSYRWALDMGKDVEAVQYLNQALAARYKASLQLRATLYVEAAYFEIFYRKDLNKAAQWLEQVKAYRNLADRFARLRMGAAAFASAGEIEEARNLIQQQLKLMENLTGGMAYAEETLLYDILKRCDELQEKASS